MVNVAPRPYSPHLALCLSHTVHAADALPKTDCRNMLPSTRYCASQLTLALALLATAHAAPLHKRDDDKAAMTIVLTQTAIYNVLFVLLFLTLLGITIYWYLKIRKPKNTEISEKPAEDRDGNRSPRASVNATE